MKSSPLFFFDLDGTLINSQPGILHCMKKALEEFCAEIPADNVLSTYIGPPLRDTFASLLKTQENATIEKAVSLYRQHYKAGGLFNCYLYEGIKDLLSCLRENNGTSYVVTAKPTVYARQIIPHLGVDEAFEDIYGAELDGRFDNKADLIAYLLDKEQISHQNCLMIGDRASDIKAAKAHNLNTIGILWGFGDREELELADADFIFEHTSELKSHLIQRLLSAEKE